MLQQISGVLSKGFSSKQIIDFLLRKYPEHEEKIKSALTAGFSIDQVLKFLAGGRKSLNEPDNKRGIQTEHRETLEQDIGRRENVNQSALAAGTLAAGAAASPMVVSALQRSLPTNLKALANMVGGNQATNQLPSPNLLGQNAQNIQTGAQAPTNLPLNPVTSQNPPVSEDNIPQPQAPIQPKGIPNPEEYLKEKGVLEKVQAQLKTGNTPEAIAATLGIKDTTGRLKAQIDPELVSAIDAYAKQKPQEMPEPKLPQSVPVEKSESVIEPEAPKIEKKSTVATPNGVGEVREIRGDKALVEVDGKIQKMNVDELENPMFSEDDIADAYDNLMSIIPEEHRSGFISWAGYDEDKNVLGFIPRGGKYEELENITPEEAKMIKEGKGVARTTGANREGLWIAGEDTRGGVISQIIHDRRKKKESSEKEQLKFDFNLPKPEKQDRGMKPQFDEMAYARGLSKERERKKKEEEKAKKKKERDEAKKRKK